MIEATFRPAEPDDVPALLTMMSALYEGDGTTPFDEHRAREAVTVLLDDPDLGRIYVIASGISVVGYMVITFGFSIESGGHNAFLDELYIQEEWRNRGLGTRAIRFAEDLCRNRGVKVVLLEVEVSNTHAQALYERVGFQRHSRYVMSKRIGS